MVDEKRIPDEESKKVEGVTRILFIDVEGLVVDTYALILGVARSVFNCKICPRDILFDLPTSSLEHTARCLARIMAKQQNVYDAEIRNISNEECQKSRCHEFLQMMKRLAITCKPYLSSTLLLDHLCEVVQECIVFVTCKPEIVIPCLKQILRLSYGADLCVEIFHSEKISYDGVFNPLYVLGRNDVLDLIRNDCFAESRTKQECQLSFFFLMKSFSLIKLCQEHLRFRFQGRNIQLTLGFRKGFSSTDLFNHSLFEKIGEEEKILQDCLPWSLESMDLSHFYTWAEFLSDMAQVQSITYVQKVTPMASQSFPICSEARFWNTFLILERAVVFDGIVVKGYGRGSSILGIPTANLNVTVPANGEQLPCPGVYFGVGSILDSETAKAPQTGHDVYDTILSVGYNPYYDNDSIVVEPHLFYEFLYDFHGVRVRLGIQQKSHENFYLKSLLYDEVVVGFLRVEANFACVEQLVQAIQLDCDVARTQLSLLKQNEPKLYQNYCNLLDPSHCEPAKA